MVDTSKTKAIFRIAILFSLVGALVEVVSERIVSKGPAFRIFYAIAHYSPEAQLGNRHPQHLTETLSTYGTDAVAHLVAILQTGVDLCESRGFSVTMQLDCGYECSQVPRFRELRNCSRAAPAGFYVNYVEHDLQHWNNDVTRIHRSVMGREIDDHDMFVYLEDDMLISAAQIQSWIHHTARLTKAGLGDRYEVGWYRQEINVTSPNLDWVLWEESNTAYPENGLNVVDLGPDLGWHVLYTGQTYQGIWMATREKMHLLKERQPQYFNSTYHLESRTNSETMANEFFWTGGFKKVIPLDTFALMWGIHHMSNKKIYINVGRPRKVADVFTDLLRMRSAKMGLSQPQLARS